MAESEANALIKASPPTPKLSTPWNPLAHTMRVMYSVWQTPSVFYYMIAISWFWLISAAFLTQIPNFNHDVLGSSGEVVTLLLCSFTVGTALGSLLCKWLSRGRIEPGLVPLGAIGITCAGLALGFSSNHFRTLSNTGLIPFFNSPRSYFNLLYMALFS
ncbi:hypothetical protein ACCI51_07230 [Microbulbifer echini]|uniref:MFS transporter n=1 Tax=Microbulbifer echini TaxID=1529067 RepID=A0ABV4NMA8_9GAMM